MIPRAQHLPSALPFSPRDAEPEAQGGGSTCPLLLTRGKASPQPFCHSCTQGPDGTRCLPDPPRPHYLPPHCILAVPTPSWPTDYTNALHLSSKPQVCTPMSLGPQCLQRCQLHRQWFACTIPAFPDSPPTLPLWGPLRQDRFPGATVQRLHPDPG